MLSSLKDSPRIIISVLMIVFSLFPSFPAETAHESVRARELINRGRKSMDQERIATSRSQFKKALEVAERENDREAQAISLGNLGTLSDMIEDFKAAIGYYQRGYDLAVKEKNEMIQLKFVTCIIKNYVQLNNLSEAKKWLEIQETLPYDKDPYMHFVSLLNRSSVEALSNDFASAMYTLNIARRIAEDYNLNSDCNGSVQMYVGDVLYKMGKYEEALEEYNIAYDTIRKNGSRLSLRMVNRALYVTYNKLNDSTKAGTYRDRYYMFNDSLFDDGIDPEKRGVNTLQDYEKRVNSNSASNFNNFFLIIIVIIFLAIVVFGVVMMIRLNKSQRLNLQMSEFLAEKGQNLKDKEKKIDKLEGMYNEIQERTQNADPMLTPEQTEALLQKIRRVMEDVDVITSENFSLQALAKLVGSNTKYVSYAINEGYGKTFKTLLNEYRIQEACKRLLDKENYGNMTIRAIHQELGFRTATSFVAAFRKVTGVTPSDYKKRHSAPDSPDEEAATDTPSNPNSHPPIY